MSLFTMFMGVNPFAGALLKALGIEEPGNTVPRLRDCYVDPEGYIVVLTRTGGPHRAEYAAENHEMTTVAGFVETFDWEVDSTYAIWRYAPAPQHAEFVAEIVRQGGACNLTEKFNTVLGRIGPKEA